MPAEPYALALGEERPGEEAAAVVHAVLAASPADELDWIECKSSLEGARNSRRLPFQGEPRVVPHLQRHGTAISGIVGEPGYGLAERCIAVRNLGPPLRDSLRFALPARLL
jgi:hypothetical protein